MINSSRLWEYPNLSALARGSIAGSLRPEAKEILAEVKRLRALANKLRKTKDGVTVAPGTNVFYIHPKSGRVYERTYSAKLDDPRSHRTLSGEVIWITIDKCYSTQEAAEAAGGNQP